MGITCFDTHSDLHSIIMPAIGTDGMAAMSGIAVRMNAAIFQRASVGTDVRMAGRIAQDGAGFRLTATDGGSVLVTDFDCREMIGQVVEVVGTKTGDAALRGIGVVALGDQVDIDLWD